MLQQIKEAVWDPCLLSTHPCWYFLWGAQSFQQESGPTYKQWEAPFQSLFVSRLHLAWRKSQKLNVFSWILLWHWTNMVLWLHRMHWLKSSLLQYLAYWLTSGGASEVCHSHAGCCSPSETCFMQTFHSFPEQLLCSINRGFSPWFWLGWLLELE